MPRKSLDREHARAVVRIFLDTDAALTAAYDHALKTDRLEDYEATDAEAVIYSSARDELDDLFPATARDCAIYIDGTLFVRDSDGTILVIPSERFRDFGPARSGLTGPLPTMPN